MDATSYNVRIWKTEIYKGTKTTTYWVRWIVGGKRQKEAFKSSGLADSFRSKLVTAARAGEAFYISTGLPPSMTQKVSDISWYEFACSYVDMEAYSGPGEVVSMPGVS